MPSIYLLSLFKCVDCRYLEYTSHIWDGSYHSDLLEKLNSWTFLLINTFILTVSLYSFLCTSNCCISFFVMSLFWWTLIFWTVVLYLLLWKRLVRHAFPRSFLVSLFTFFLTTLLNLTCTLLVPVKSRTHALYLFQQLSLTYSTVPNTLYWDMLTFNLAMVSWIFLAGAIW